MYEMYFTFYNLIQFDKRLYLCKKKYIFYIWEILFLPYFIDLQHNLKSTLENAIFHILQSSNGFEDFYVFLYDCVV